VFERSSFSVVTLVCNTWASIAVNLSSYFRCSRNQVSSSPFPLMSTFPRDSRK
jgi:hypothetical protein